MKPSFRAAGKGPGVVCLHSSASSSGQWRPLMDQLADRFHVLAPDFHGYGESPAWSDARDLTLADEARLVEPVFRAAGDRFHLVGHSYGGAVALRVALDDPKRIRSLVLFEPVLFALLFEEDPEQPGAREIAAVRDDTIAAVARGDLQASAERFVDYWMGAGAWKRTPDKRRSAAANSMRKVKAEWRACFDEPTPLEAFSHLAIPTLFLLGVESPASSRGVARLLTRTLPRVTVEELPGIGHLGPITHAERINDAIEAHLTRIDSPRLRA
jgi:pimeloyl-ACP methyl ester carboxylesterase